MLVGPSVALSHVLFGSEMSLTRVTLAGPQMFCSEHQQK